MITHEMEDYSKFIKRLKDFTRGEPKVHYSREKLSIYAENQADFDTLKNELDIMGCTYYTFPTKDLKTEKLVAKGLPEMPPEEINTKMAVNNFDVTSLSIGHWNANGVRRNLSEIRQFMLEHNVDILLLNETKLKSTVKFNILGYDSVRKDRADGRAGGGVMILIKQSVQYTEIPAKTNNLETVAIKLSNNLIIVSLYNPLNSKIIANDLNILNNPGNK